ncbi:MAG: MmcQ/YjbR family DNA-binding protein [Acidimicrobiales bacterium]
MAHPQQFDMNDPALGRLREICLALPGAAEKVSHGRPMFFTKKIFAGFGAVTKGDHHSGRYDQSLVFMPADDEVAALEQHAAVFKPAYWGPYGWLGYDLSGTPDWDEVSELVEESFRHTAAKKLIAALDDES